MRNCRPAPHCLVTVLDLASMTFRVPLACMSMYAPPGVQPVTLMGEGQAKILACSYRQQQGQDAGTHILLTAQGRRWGCSPTCS